MRRVQFDTRADGAKRAGRTEDDRNRWNKRSAAEIPNTELIVASLEGVNKNYGTIRALRGVDFRVRAGEVVALLGPNGAGKTTAVKLLLGLMQPNAGRVRVFGGDPTNPENRMRTGAMLQVGRVPETLRVREHIDLFSTYYEKPMPSADVLAAAGLEKLGDRKFGDLSGGQRQRVLFALAICGDPDLLFLDEPTVGLDVEARRMLWDEIRRMVVARQDGSADHALSAGSRRARRPRRRHQQGRNHCGGNSVGDQGEDRRQADSLHHQPERETLRQIPGVTEVKEDREAVEIHAVEAEPVVRELLARDAGLSGLEITSAGLEEAFLALTHDTAPERKRSN